MDGSQAVAKDWSEVTFIQRQNVTPELVRENIRANAGRPLPGVTFKGICICASGPSLGDHVEDIRFRQQTGFAVASMNGSHNFLIDHGIMPDYYFQIDAREGNLSFLDKANDHTTYVIGSQCQPEIFDALEGRKVLLWQVHNYEGAADAIREKAPGATIFAGAFNVGQSCLNPILAMGYRIWHLFGYDGSMREENKHAFAQTQNEDEQVCDFKYRGKTYRATPTMAHHAQTFPERFRMFRAMGIDIQVFGDGLLPAMLADDIETTKVAKPKKGKSRALAKLPVVTFKWKGHIPYTATDVNIWASMFDRWLERPCELICITDDAEGIDGGVRTLEMWRDHFEHGRDWHRLKLFSEEMADLIGSHFVCSDLDVLLCDKVDSLFDHDHAFRAWRDPFRPKQYCTSLFQMDAGAFPHVIDDFDVEKAMALRTSGKFNGYDQAWISEVLPGQAVWTACDGVLSFKRHIIRADELDRAKPGAKEKPPGARIINFHGKFNPRDSDVQEACPWIRDYYR